jgi:transposase
MGKRWNVPYKKVVLEYAELCGRDTKSYRSFGVSKSTFYEWRKAFRENGAAGLIPKKPVALHHPRALSPEAVQKTLELRKTYCPRSAANILVPSTLSRHQRLVC